MDATTEMLVSQIIEKGWYKPSDTLGEGGWSYFYNKAGHNWKRYVLSGFEVSTYNEETELYYNEICSITAKDDETAIRAFESLYHLEKIEGWEIVEKIVEYRTVTMKVEKE